MNHTHIRPLGAFVKAVIVSCCVMAVTLLAKPLFQRLMSTTPGGIFTSRLAISGASLIWQASRL